MSDHQNITGSCLCGAVRFAVKPPFTAFRYCHCSRCRKASGSAHASNLFVPRAQFSWLAGETEVKRFDVPDAQRFSVWFCSHCGTRMPHAIRTREDMLVPAGVLDTDPQIRPGEAIFCGSKPTWYIEPQHLKGYEEYPV